MADYSTAIVAPSARWSCRIALFAVALLAVGVVLHRLSSLATPAMVNLLIVGYGAAALALLVGLAALVQIWRTGFSGAGLAAVGVMLPLMVSAAPLVQVPAYLNMPHISDVSTDLTSPPRFVVLAKRPDGANSAAYPGRHVGELQAKAYPDLRTVMMDRSAEETFELVEEAVKRLRWRVAAAEPPTGRPAKAGTLEATDQSLIVGFTDDIVIRVEGTQTRTRVDVRSASRYGKFDLGENAARVRRFFTELQARVDATAPGVLNRRALTSARARALLKQRQKAADLQKAGSRNVKGHAPSDARRAPGQKERQR